jgi:hypothetical protein
MTFPLEDLAQTADELRKIRIDATYEIVYGPHGGLEGLEVGGDFFPLWELNLPENRAALEEGSFSLIKARRGEDWSIEPPKVARGASM